MTVMADAESSLHRARRIIESREQRTTDKRCKLLAVMLAEQKPLSAYELTDKYNREYGEHIIATSVYRILDWLVNASVAHRLNALNKYVACQQEVCIQHGSISLLVICKHCEKVSEKHISDSLRQAIDKHVSQSKFSHVSQHIEMTGECEKCQNQRQQRP